MKRRPILIVLAAVVLAFLGFLVYGILSADLPTEEDPTGTPAPTAEEPTTDPAASGDPIVASGSDDAVQRVSQLTGLAIGDLVFLNEDRMIDNGDGTLSVSVNQEADPTIPVYLVCPKGTAEGEEIIHSYAVVVGTSDVYADVGDQSGIFDKKG